MSHVKLPLRRTLMNVTASQAASPSARQPVDLPRSRRSEARSRLPTGLAREAGSSGRMSCATVKLLCVNSASRRWLRQQKLPRARRR